MKVPLLSINPKEHSQHTSGQSDRVCMILWPAVLEDMLVIQLRDTMATLNNDEKDRILRFGGMAGSFSDRIKLAQAFGVIDRSMTRRLDMMREIRNVAAHSHALIDFSVKEIRDAMASMYETRFRDIIRDLTQSAMRNLFRASYSLLLLKITRMDDDLPKIDQMFNEMFGDSIAEIKAGEPPLLEKWLPQ